MCTSTCTSLAQDCTASRPTLERQSCEDESSERDADLQSFWTAFVCRFRARAFARANAIRKDLRESSIPSSPSSPSSASRNSFCTASSGSLTPTLSHFQSCSSVWHTHVHSMHAAWILHACCMHVACMLHVWCKYAARLLHQQELGPAEHSDQTLQESEAWRSSVTPPPSAARPLRPPRAVGGHRRGRSRPVTCASTPLGICR